MAMPGSSLGAAAAGDPPELEAGGLLAALEGQLAGLERRVAADIISTQSAAAELEDILRRASSLKDVSSVQRTLGNRAEQLSHKLGSVRSLDPPSPTSMGALKGLEDEFGARFADMGGTPPPRAEAAVPTSPPPVPLADVRRRSVSSVTQSVGKGALPTASDLRATKILLEEVEKFLFHSKKVSVPTGKQVEMVRLHDAYPRWTSLSEQRAMQLLADCRAAEERCNSDAAAAESVRGATVAAERRSSEIMGECASLERQLAGGRQRLAAAEAEVEGLQQELAAARQAAQDRAGAADASIEAKRAELAKVKVAEAESADTLRLASEVLAQRQALEARRVPQLRSRLRAFLTHQQRQVVLGPGFAGTLALAALHGWQEVRRERLTEEAFSKCRELEVEQVARLQAMGAESRKAALCGVRPSPVKWPESSWAPVLRAFVTSSE